MRVTSLLPRNLCERLHESNANSFSSVSAEALRPEQRRSQCLQRSNGCRRGATEQEVRTTNVPVRWSPTLVFIICEGRKTKPSKKREPKLRPFAFQNHFSSFEHIPFVFLPFQAASWFFLLLLFSASSSRRDNEEEMRRMKDVSTSLWKNETGIEMTRKRIPKALGRFKSIFFSFYFFKRPFPPSLSPLFRHGNRAGADLVWI